MARASPPSRRAARLQNESRKQRTSALGTRPLHVKHRRQVFTSLSFRTAVRGVGSWTPRPGRGARALGAGRRSGWPFHVKRVVGSLRPELDTTWRAGDDLACRGGACADGGSRCPKLARARHMPAAREAERSRIDLPSCLHPYGTPPGSRHRVDRLICRASSCAHLCSPATRASIRARRLRRSDVGSPC